MLGVIIIARLHAMHQRSRKMLVFLIVFFLAVTIGCGVLIAIENGNSSWKELVLSGTYQCIDEGSADGLLTAGTWILYSVWEVLALSLAVRIAFKQSRTRWTIEDRLMALIKTHVIYFAAFAAATCLNLGSLSQNISSLSSTRADIYYGVVEIVLLVQMFVLGPRLLLSVREYNAKLVADSDSGTGIQLLSRSAYTTRQLAVVCSTGNGQHVSGTLQEA